MSLLTRTDTMQARLAEAEARIERLEAENARLRREKERLDDIEAGGLTIEHRHGLPAEMRWLVRYASTHLATLPAQELELLKRIHSHTNVPLLSGEEYQRLFACLAKELAERTYDLSATSKAIRDRLAGEDAPIPRQAITFVLKAIGYSGHSLAAGDTPERLALAFRRNLLEMLNSDIELDSTGRELIDRWLGIRRAAGVVETGQ